MQNVIKYTRYVWQKECIINKERTALLKKQERKRKKSAEKISKLARILLYIKVRFRSRDSLIKRRYRDLRKKKGENKYE